MQTALQTNVVRRGVRPTVESALSVAISASSPALRARIEVLARRAGAHIVGSDAACDILLIAMDSSTSLPSSAASLSLLLPVAGSACVIWSGDVPTPSTVSRLLRTGVAGIVPVDIEGSKFQQALHAIRAGLQVIDPAVTRAAVEIVPKPTAASEELTDREQQVLSMMAEGLANKEISSRLAISTHTVKFHISSILGKMGASSRTEAVAIGVKTGRIAI
jgi:NarL family two-component system response regulator YdfI